MSQKHNLGTGLGLVGLIMSLSFLSACSQMQGDGLFTDALASRCPPGCATDLKPDDNQMYIKIMNVSTAILPASASTIDIGGECYASLYSDNYIAVSIDGRPQPTYYGVNTQPSILNNAKCKNGKFDITVDLTGLPTTGRYNVRVQLFAIDTDNVPHTNASEGSSSLEFIRTTQ